MAFRSLQATTTQPSQSGGFRPLGAKIPVVNQPEVQEEKKGVEPTFKASMGGAGTILPNVAKTFGNIPSNVADLANVGLVQPAKNIVYNIPKTQFDIYKNRGFLQGNVDIAAGFADTGKKIVTAPYNLFKGMAEKKDMVTKLAPAQERNQKIKDDLTALILKNKSDGKDTSRLINSLRQLVGTEQEVNALIGTKEEREQKPVDALSSVAKYPIERPVDIPLALYAGPNKKGTDLISEIASPVLRGADTRIAPVIQSKLPTVAKAVDDLEQTYVDIISGTTPGKKKVDLLSSKTEALNSAGTQGKTPMRTLAEEGIIPERKGTKIDSYEQAQAYREKIAPLREANQAALQEVGLSTAPTKIDDLESAAIAYAKTPQNINSGRFAKMEKEIQKEFEILRQYYPSGEIPLSVVDDIKAARWDNVFKNKSLVEADTLKKDSEYAIAKSLQKNIEQTAEKAGHVDVAQLNREIGDRLEAAKFLEDLNGKTIKGGRLLKYVTTTLGSTMGQTIPGKIIGALGGNLIGEMIISKNLSGPVKRMLLKNLETKSPEAYQKTIDWLSKQNLDRETRLLLPAGKAPENVIIAPNPIEYTPGGVMRENKIQLLDAQKNPVSANPQTGRFQKTYNTQSKSPTNQQTTPAINSESKIPIFQSTSATINKTPAIPKSTSNLIDLSIPQKGKTGIPNKQGGFARVPFLPKPVKIGQSIFKQIDEPTKREMIQVIDYLRSGKEVKNIEDTLSRLAQKYNISEELSNSKIADLFEKLVANTKTK